MRIKDKYRRLTGSLFLVFYSFFLIFASLHSLNHQLNYGNSVKFEFRTESNKNIDPFLDADSNCQLLLFSSSNFLIPKSNPLALLSVCESGNRNYNSKNNYETQNLIRSGLRAPPYFS